MICLWCCRHWIRTAPRVQGDTWHSQTKKPDSISFQRILAENIREKMGFPRIIISVLCVAGKVTLKATKREECAGCGPSTIPCVPKSTGPRQVRLSTRALSHPETHWTSTHWSQQSEDRKGEEHPGHTGNQPSVSHRHWGGQNWGSQEHFLMRLGAQRTAVGWPRVRCHSTVVFVSLGTHQVGKAGRLMASGQCLSPLRQFYRCCLIR